MKALNEAIKAVGSQAELARRLGGKTVGQTINNWRKRGIPAERCAEIEAITGVRCEELRPDLTWQRDEHGKVLGHFVPAEKAA